MSGKEMTFEQALTQLETILAQLESGELSLEESVALYEKGRQLSALCQKQLNDAELRIHRINDDGTLDPN